jgi:hypothetical protein
MVQGKDVVSAYAGEAMSCMAWACGDHWHVGQAVSGEVRRTDCRTKESAIKVYNELLQDYAARG